jgi:hypothetical protein
MKIKLVDIASQSDHSGPVLDIIAESTQDCFDLGMLFEKIYSINGCVWKLETSIRLPLVYMDEVGLAITYKKEE